MARLEPSGKLVLTKEVRRLYDLPVFTAAGTLSITSADVMHQLFFARYSANPYRKPRS
ncbi:hypothetical protein YEP4_08247 [Yersinia enterocolitica subsp. palearctica YE-P4]|uniref:Uncharacterized protein n=2 Tax=Yersinia enterocolitica TaxID=630 RepID=A0A0H3NYN1_YERE1|nr:hypothetical protein YE149_08334 [Yersinia enterocolitica subsp. palearctica YE-149]EOR77191.1 hypothetical protein YE150_08289 [Yersinia enterocolitica subsp. palearctica YE-150]EOR77754.1 hypothetical protein YEP1_08345 [Yersinia enterocolitica subsp. palearctica YE-P1]EOR82248.1 hypothetical protein YEP4_08247 [Yersinia enterocolitica subsp. palearctica YE-P4]CBY26447.1 hypothetical protein Y11_17341 [Yersinia enterocolitica subsp. palearctica Y11]CCO69339.1 hypothetical protein D322_246